MDFSSLSHSTRLWFPSRSHFFVLTHLTNFEASAELDLFKRPKISETYISSIRQEKDSPEILEAIAFARKSGVDAGALMEFLTATLFNAPVYKTYGGLIVEGKHEPAGFALPLGLKDVRLVLQAAEAASVPMPIASVVRDRFITAMARGNQDKVWSILGRVAAEDAGLPQTARAAG